MGMLRSASRAYGRALANNERQRIRVAHQRTLDVARASIVQLVGEALALHAESVRSARGRDAQIKHACSELTRRGIDVPSAASLEQMLVRINHIAKKRERLLPHGSVAALGELGEQALRSRVAAWLEFSEAIDSGWAAWRSSVSAIMEAAEAAGVDMTTAPIPRRPGARDTWSPANAALEIPRRMSQRWLDQHLSAMSPPQLSALAEELERRGWSSDELDQRVYPLAGGS